MQRVRVGLTGLGAVLLIVAVSAAIFESARNQPANKVAAQNASEQVVANMVGNTVETPNDPLTEIGVTPAGPATNNAVAGEPAK